MKLVIDRSASSVEAALTIANGIERAGGTVLSVVYCQHRYKPALDVWHVIARTNQVDVAAIDDAIAVESCPF